MVFGIYDTVVAFDHLRHTLTVLAHDEADRPGGAARMIDQVFSALDAPLPPLTSAAGAAPEIHANGTPQATLTQGSFATGWKASALGRNGLWDLGQGGQVSLAIPLLLLYEISIFSCRWVEKKKAEREAAEEAELSGKSGG